LQWINTHFSDPVDNGFMMTQLTKKPEAGPLLTESEMSALFPTGVGLQAGTRRWRTWFGSVAVGTDTRFKFRMTFLLAIVSYYIVKLLFFPALVSGNFDTRVSNATLKHYFQMRAGFVAFASLAYLFSYLRDWHFEKIALGFVMVAITALVMDYFNAYVYLSPASAQWIPGLIAARLLAVFCLLMNAMNARHAPPMPRRLWS
jgi:hypothetical protein